MEMSIELGTLKCLIPLINDVDIVYRGVFLAYCINISFSLTAYVEKSIIKQ